MINKNENFKFNLEEYLEYENKLYDYLEERYGNNKIFDLNTILMDRELFKAIYNDIYYILEEGFEVEKIRKFPVMVTFNKEENNEVITMEIRHMLINLIFLRAFVELDVDIELNNSYLFDARKINNKEIANYINNKIIIPFRDLFTENEELFMKLNNVCHNIIYRLCKIPRDFNPLIGTTINLEDSFIKLSNENERFNEIINTKIPEEMQPKEIEEMLDKLSKEEIEIMKNTPNCLQDVLIAGTGIKTQQLREFSISGGMKSDLLGNTIPIPINSNFIVGGLNSITNYYLDSQAARKPLIANKEKMGNSGHLSLLLKLACVGIYISKTTKDCHTPHTVKLFIENEKFLQKCVGRYYRKEGERKFKLLKSTDKHLIGTELLFRDPSTCACKDGICHTCYGAMSKINMGMDVGILAATIISRPLGQNILSTKHLNTTVSKLIEFDNIFNNFFKLEANQIKLLNDNEAELNLQNYELVLDNIVKLDEMSDIEKFNKFIPFIKVRNSKNHDEYFEIVESEMKELFIHPELDKLLKELDENDEDSYIIPFNMIDDIYLFTINIKNNELTKPLKDLDNLLKGSYFGDINVSIDQMEQKFIELMIESNIDITSIHAATMLRNLVRDRNNYLERPDFNKIFVDYVVLGYHDSLANNPAITTSLAYDYLKRQLTTYTTYQKRSSSPLDVLFRRTLD